MKLICLHGAGAQAAGIIIDIHQITKSKEIRIPQGDTNWSCSTINAILKVENQTTIPLPSATPTLRRSSQTNSNVTGRGGRREDEMVPIVSETAITSLAFKESMCIIAPPFIVKVFFNGVPNNPLELILAVKAAAIEFNSTPSSLQGIQKC